MRHFIEAIGRAKPANALMRPLEVIVLKPQPRPVLHVFESVKQGAGKELLLDGLPEPFDFPLRLGVVRLRTDMPDLHPGHLLLKLRLPTPTRVLSSVVRQHLGLGLVLGHRSTEHLQHIVRLLRHIQPEPRDKTRIIVDETYEVNALFFPRIDADVRLPHQMRSLYIGTAFLGRFIVRLRRPPLRPGFRLRLWRQQSLLMKHSPDSLMTCLHEKHPL